MSGAPAPKTGVRSSQASRRRARERELGDAVRVVKRRAGGRCEVDGCEKRDEVTHHKAGRVGPGCHEPERLLRCCLAHHLEIHANPSWAMAQGYMESRTR